MKTFKHFIFFVFFFLTHFGGTAWADMMIEGFETKTPSSSYKNTFTVSTEESDCGLSWEIYYGNVSTTSNIDGSNSVALQLYCGEDNYGYLQTTTAVSDLVHVSFSAKAATVKSASILMNIEYSTDGETWEYMKMGSPSGDNFEAQSLTSSAAGYTVFVPSGVTGDCLIRFSINEGSTKPSSDKAQLTIDNVTFFTDESGQKFELVDNVSKLSSGDEIIILNSGGTKALSITQNTSNRSASTNFSLSDGVVTLGDENTVQIIRLLSASTNWAFFVGQGYLYAAGKSSNLLKTQSTNDGNGEWAISISDGVASITAQGENTNNVMQNNSALFACYSSASQTAVKIYKRQTTLYDYFKDIMHDNEVANQSGDYSMPNISDESKDATLVGSHYKFVGWVAKDDVNTDGTLKSGYTLYAPGMSHTADGTTYYAIWATDL